MPGPSPVGRAKALVDAPGFVPVPVPAMVRGFRLGPVRSAAEPTRNSTAAGATGDLLIVLACPLMLFAAGLLPRPALLTAAPPS